MKQSHFRAETEVSSVSSQFPSYSSKKKKSNQDSSSCIFCHVYIEEDWLIGFKRYQDTRNNH